MSIQKVFPYPYIILDACCVISLYGSGRIGEVLASLGVSVAITTYVHENEILGIQGLPNADDVAGQQGTWIDLQPLINDNLLALTSPLSEDEETAYVNFAAFLDDGEAITSAIAVKRNWAIAIDDRRSINFLKRAVPTLPIISTLELIKHWVETTNLPAHEVKAALSNIRIRARYKPGSSHPLYAWWQAFLRE